MGDSEASFFKLCFMKVFFFQLGSAEFLFLLPLAAWLLSLLALTHGHHGLCRNMGFLLLFVWGALAEHSCMGVCMHTCLGEWEGQRKTLGMVPQVPSNVAVGIASFTGMLLG